MRSGISLEQAKAAFRKAVTRIEIQSYETATLGWRQSATVVLLEVPGRPNFVYITKSDGTRTIALNEANVPLSAFLPVKIRLENETIVIKGKNVAATNALTNLPPSPYGVPTHPHAFLSLSDVLPTDLADGQFFMWDATAGKLVNVEAPGALVTSVNGEVGDAALTSDEIPEGGDNLYISAVELIKLAGIETAADVTDQANVAAAIDTSTEATTFADANKFALLVGGALRWLSGTNIKATLKTYFDTLYGLLGSANIWTAVNTFNNNVIAKHFRGQYSGGTDYGFYTGTNLEVMANAYWDGSNYKRYVTGKASKLVLDDDGTIYLVNTNTSAAADATISDFTIRGRFLPTGQFDVQAGTSADVARVGGTMNAQATFVSNALTAETNLHVYTVPANTLASVGDEIIYEAHGIYAATNNGKMLRLYVNGTVVLAHSVTTNNGTWRARITVSRYDASNVRAFAQLLYAPVPPSAANIVMDDANVAVTFSSTFVIGVTGQSASGGGEMASEFASVKYYPVNT